MIVLCKHAINFVSFGMRATDPQNRRRRRRRSQRCAYSIIVDTRFALLNQLCGPYTSLLVLDVLNLLQRSCLCKRLRLVSKQIPLMRVWGEQWHHRHYQSPHQGLGQAILRYKKYTVLGFRCCRQGAFSVCEKFRNPKHNQLGFHGKDLVSKLLQRASRCTHDPDHVRDFQRTSLRRAMASSPW